MSDNNNHQDSGLSGLALLTATWLLEIPGILLRFPIVLLMLAPIWLPLLIKDAEVYATLGFNYRSQASLLEFAQFSNNVIAALFISAFPLILSVMTVLFLPGGFLMTRFAMGAREPSKREREYMTEALRRLGVGERSKKGITKPTEWFVMDNITLNAYVVGTTLYVNRELLKSPHLASVLAHELGHINTYDGRMTLALRRLVLPPVHYLSRSIQQAAPGTFPIVVATSHLEAYIQAAQAWFLSLFLSLIGGGFGLWVLSPLWTWYWRHREYKADDFAAKLGVAGELIDYLEEHQFFDVATPYFLSSHPYTELRIDRLMHPGEAASDSNTKKKRRVKR